MPHDKRPLAERLRAHREAFVLAQELGCTPAEAAAELTRRQAATKNRAAMARLHAKMAGRSVNPKDR